MEKKNHYIDMLKSFVSNIWYVIALVAACTIVIISIVNWETTVAVLEKLISILMPFILGFFLAYLIYPLVKLIQKPLDRIKKGEYPRVKRYVSVFIAYLIVLGVLTVIILYIFPQIKDSTKELGNFLTKGYNYVITHEQEVNNRLPFIDISDIIVYIKANWSGQLMNYSSDIFPYVYQLSSSVFSLIYNVFFGLVISVYIVLDSKNLAKGLKRIVYAISPAKREERVWDTLMQCNHIFNGFLFGKAIDSLIIGLLCLIAMTILNLPFALLFSVIVCITNMIPYFGPIFGAIPGVLIYLFMGDPKQVLIFAIMILVLQQFDGLYLGPKILGDLTGIKPLWVIFGITVGGAYFGVIGMFLGVPTVAVFMYLIHLFTDRKLKKKQVQLPDSK
ncbi:MAG: AI-2E family transporter [Lachnospiraceae bacterium]|nr:AI-2E family transporter [Lachnospiraceae bacterium]